ncbi:MAG: TolC family protein [Bacteroidota bacterium]
MDTYNRKQMLLSILLVSYSCLAMAQDSLRRGQNLWRLQDCIQHAIDNNIQVTTLLLIRDISGEQQLQAKAAIRPDLYGSASPDVRHIGRNSSGSTISIGGSLGVNSTLNLYKGGYLRNDIELKGLLVESANLSLLERINDITVQVTQAFLAVLMDKENIVYTQDLLNTTNAQLQRAKQIFAVGSLSRKELVQAEAQLAQDRYNLATSINTERRDRITLKQLLQISDTSFDIQRPDTIVNTGIIPPLAEVRSTALANRPEVKNADVRVDAAKVGLAKARALAKPSLDLRSGLGTSYANDPSTSFIRQFDNNFYQQVGLALSVPIFTKRINRTNINIAKIGIEQAALDRQYTRVNLELNVERAFANVLNAQAQYDAAVVGMASAREVYNIASEELRIGSSNRVELIIQRNQYIQALQNYLNAKYNAALAARIYDFYRGVPITID